MSTPLPTTAWAVLGLLSFDRELSGYDCKKWADSSLAFFYWSPAMSQIYSELRRLEKVGYVTSRTAAQDQLRNKRLYRITDSGRAAIADWVQSSPVEPPVLKHGVALRIWLGHLADPDKLRDILVEHREYAATMAVKAAKAEELAANDPAWAYPDLVERWCRRYYESERDLAGHLLADVDELQRRQARRGQANRRQPRARLSP